MNLTLSKLSYLIQSNLILWNDPHIYSPMCGHISSKAWTVPLYLSNAIFWLFTVTSLPVRLLDFLLPEMPEKKGTPSSLLNGAVQLESSGRSTKAGSKSNYRNFISILKNLPTEKKKTDNMSEGCILAFKTFTIKLNILLSTPGKCTI